MVSLFNRRLLWSALGFLVLILVTGTVGFMTAEDLSPASALYLTMITLTTVGYGDLAPATAAGRLVAVLVVVGGFGVFSYLLVETAGLIVQGHLRDALGRRRMFNKIASLRGHVVLCGAGRVGSEVIEVLRQENQDLVVVEYAQELCRDLLERGLLVIEGDATLDHTLKSAGVERAAGLVTALPDDAANLYVTLSARELNPEIRVISRASRNEAAARLLRAGAEKVVMPATLGGRRMATALLKPASVHFLETVTESGNLELLLEELLLEQGSPLEGKTLAVADLKQNTGATIVAILRGQQVITNPGAAVALNIGDLLIALGNQDSLRALEALCRGA